MDMVAVTSPDENKPVTPIGLSAKGIETVTETEVPRERLASIGGTIAMFAFVN